MQRLLARRAATPVKLTEQEVLDTILVCLLFVLWCAVATGAGNIVGSVVGLKNDTARWLMGMVLVPTFIFGAYRLGKHLRGKE